jgi:hypothetical protein
MSPIMIDPSAPPPPVPVEVTSADGVLTVSRFVESSKDFTGSICKRRSRVISDDDTVPSGVYLFADFSSLAGGTPGRAETILARNDFPAPGQEYGITPFPAAVGLLRVENTIVHSGLNSIAVKAPATGNPYQTATLSSPATYGYVNGDSITLAVWIYISSASTPRTQLAFLGGTGVTSATIVSTGITQRDQWVRVSVTTSVILDTGTLIIRAYGPNGTTVENYFDDWTLNKGTTPVENFSGDTVSIDPANIAYRWVGAAGASSSQKYIPAITSVPPSQDLWPNAVQFVRLATSDGKIPDQPVRSGDWATAVGGKARAYDMEAPVNVVSQWYAIPIMKDGSMGTPSLPVSTTVAFPAGTLDCCIKPTGKPALTTMVQIVQPLPTFTRPARNNLSNVQGSSYAAGSWDVRLGMIGTFTFWTPDWVERDRIMDALSNGPVFVQINPSYLVADFYALPGDLSEAPMEADFNDPGRTWTVDFTVIARPATVDAPLVIPGRSYADLKDVVGDRSTYFERKGIFPLYADAGRPVGASHP